MPRTQSMHKVRYKVMHCAYKFTLEGFWLLWQQDTHACIYGILALWILIVLVCVLAQLVEIYCISLKGKFHHTTMPIGWVESKFRNPTVKFWANLDNPFKRTNYAKFCMSPSLDGTLPESVIPRENNSPLTLYIAFIFLLICILFFNGLRSWRFSVPIHVH